MQISKDKNETLRASIVAELAASRGEDEAVSEWIHRDSSGDIIHDTDMVKLTAESFDGGSIRREYVGVECPIRRGRTHFDRDAGDWVVECIIPDTHVIWEMRDVPMQLDDGTFVLVERKDADSRYVRVFASELETLDGEPLVQNDRDFKAVVRQRLSSRKATMRKAKAGKTGKRSRAVKDATVVGTLMSMSHGGRLMIFRHGHKDPEITLPANAFAVRDAYLAAFGSKVPTADEIADFTTEHCAE